MDFNRRANRVAAQLVSFLEERMRGPALHQANEENEEFCHTPAGGQPNQRLAGARPCRGSKLARRRLAPPTRGIGDKAES